MHVMSINKLIKNGGLLWIKIIFYKSDVQSFKYFYKIQWNSCTNVYNINSLLLVVVLFYYIINLEGRGFLRMCYPSMNALAESLD